VSQPAVVDVLEQFLPGQLLAPAHDRCEPAVAQPHLVRQPALPPEPEPHLGALDAGVTVAHRRQPERPVQAGVLVVADPDQGQLQEPHDRGEHLLAGQTAPGEVSVRPATDPGQGLGEGDHAAEVLGATTLPPLWVVAVLLPPTRIAPGRLQVPVRPWADPHVGPGRRDDDGPDALELVPVTDGPSLRVAVREASSGTVAGEARSGVRRIAQATRAGDGTWIVA
jgi:hypothetical protein